MSNKTKTPKGKSAAIVSYLFFFLGSIIAIFMNMEDRHDFARFHIRQSFGLHFIFIAFGQLLSGLDSIFNNIMIFYSFWIFYFVLWIYGFFGAISNKKNLIPILGNLFQNIFKVL